MEGERGDWEGGREGFRKRGWEGGRELWGRAAGGGKPRGGGGGWCSRRRSGAWAATRCEENLDGKGKARAGEAACLDTENESKRGERERKREQRETERQ